MGKLFRSRYFRRHFFSFLSLLAVIIAGLTVTLFFPIRKSLEKQQLDLVEKYRDEVIISLDNWIRYARREVKVGAFFIAEYFSSGTAPSREIDGNGLLQLPKQRLPHTGGGNTGISR